MIYPGSELEIFSRAVNWKGYWSSLISPHIKGRVLEVGAGIGSSTVALSGCEMDSWTCLEPDPNLASQIHLNHLLHSENYEVIVGGINDVSNKKLYDTILYIDVLEHINDDRQELENAFKLLSQSGKIIILAPAHQWLYSKFDESIGHYRRYNKSILIEIIPDELRLLRLCYLDSVGLFASLANRFILNSPTPSGRQIKVWDRIMVKFSRYIDPILLYKVGKSVLGIWSLESK